MSEDADAIEIIVGFVAELSEDDYIDEALDFILDVIDELCHEGHFKEVDTLLDAVNVTKLAPAILVGFYTFTYPAREKLSQREVFRANMEVQIRRTIPADEADFLFRNLK